MQHAKAVELLSNGQYNEALDIFADVSAPPQSVLSFFPEHIAGDLGFDRTELEKVQVKSPPPSIQSGKEAVPSNGSSVSAPDVDNELKTKLRLLGIILYCSSFR